MLKFKAGRPVRPRKAKIIMNKKIYFAALIFALAGSGSIYAKPVCGTLDECGAAARSADAATRAAAMDKLKVYKSSAVPILTEALKDEDSNVRAEAAAALGGVGTPAKDAVPALTEALKDPFMTVGARAAMALGQIGPDAKEAAPALLEFLRSNPDCSVIEALGKIGPAVPAATAAELDAFQQGNPDLSECAQKALLKIKPQDKAEKAAEKAPAK